MIAGLKHTFSIQTADGADSGRAAFQADSDPATPASLTLVARCTDAAGRTLTPKHAAFSGVWKRTE